ncbi:MAG: dihydroorotase [Endozoicomonadaceae bacterium]|nr:dihydroorotase [Endozoicomonadaceae bacterium]
MTTEFYVTQPDDFHLHLRDGSILEGTVKASARYFSRAIIMPNLIPPVTTAEKAAAYKKRIKQHIPDASNFTPLMTLYLTDNTTPEQIKLARQTGDIYAMKLYPAGATTNSNAGVTEIKHLYPVFEAMAETGLPLLVHGEVTSPEIDIFEREKVFLDTILIPLSLRYPQLKIVMEHITTSDAVDFVTTASDNIAATITPQHLMFNRNHMLVGGIKPHLYCLPILKRERHQQTLLQAAVSGNPKFFAGTDSAPHPQHAKESACGCAGCFSACCALELYADVFEAADKLEMLEGFVSFYGADFYNLPRNNKKVLLQKKSANIPERIMMGHDTIIPLNAGQTTSWSVVMTDA